jgi:hypothetical protein
MNSTRLNFSNSQVLLMLISKSTEILGNFVENDYVLLAIPVEVQNSKVEVRKPVIFKPSAEHEVEKAELE